jgi:hypothetical protein
VPIWVLSLIMVHAEDDMIASLTILRVRAGSAHHVNGAVTVQGQHGVGSHCHGLIRNGRERC